MSCCDALGPCQQGHGCACHETHLDDVQLEDDGTQARLGLLLCILSAVVVMDLIIFGVTQ